MIGLLFDIATGILADHVVISLGQVVAAVVVVGTLVKLLNVVENQCDVVGKGGAERGFCWILQDFEEEGVAVEENGWRHWKEEQNGWSKTTGVMDL
ncbi:hypothetical protein PPACK8108_LOCUS4078 [Phakopsora pachyrhizi]|uniref:Uncharacterized protein n=1 Tax=Phakopsora pachyrhizi TaxID=170000 RepID=A0AAV0ANX2_PHAPC|nr:hypothetical protein PPACK8108_LOCUS4078 [Phakopsora pachyrhizi]